MFIFRQIYKGISLFYKTLHCIAKYLIRAVLGILVVCCIISIIAWAGLHNLYEQSKEEEYNILSNINEGTFHRMMNTILYDSDGDKMCEIKATDFQYTQLHDISSLIQEGYIAVEDSRFKEHNGVDPKALARAGLAYVKNHGKVTQGGSTITQQVVKNTLLTQEQTLSRKAVEALLAIDIEKKFTKADIMEYYLNSCYYGNGCYGVGSACRYYFGCKPDEVTVGQAALIVGMSNNPNNVNPVASEDAAQKKRHSVLLKMKKAGVITENQYKDADKEDIAAKKITSDTKAETYQESYAIHCAAIELMKKDGFDFKYRFTDQKEYKKYKKQYSKMYQKYTQLIRGGGYKIYTSFNQKDQKNLQNAVDDVLDKKSKKKQKDGRYLLQGAAVSIDNKTGYVTAIVGGRGTEDQYNRAFLASRQSGSAIKPLIDYGPAFDTGKYFPSLVKNDSPIENGPKNAGGGYQGNVTLRYAIKDSINTVAYNTLQEIGIGTGLDYLGEMEFSTLSPLDNNSSAVALGGFTNGVHVTDMARGYATIANEGKYRDRTCVTKITNDLQGTLYTENKETKQIYEESTAYMITSCMKDVFEDGGTGKGLKPKEQTVAGKTGTTNSLKDGWFCGYSVDTTCAVWVGNDDSTVVDGNYGASYAGKIWTEYMNKTGGGKDDFEKPNTVEGLYVDNNGYPTNTNTGKKDLFSVSKEKTAKDQKDDIELQNAKAAAEAAVSKLEAFTIDSLEDYYTGYATVLKNAQNAVAAINDVDEQIPYLERINTKVQALSEEAKGWGDVDEAKKTYEAQKEKDRQAKKKQEQEEKNRANRINSQVNKFKKYIDMINGLDEYSEIMENLLTKAKNALDQIEDPAKKSEMTILYNDAAEHVNEMKETAEEEETEDESEENL